MRESIRAVYLSLPQCTVWNNAVLFDVRKLNVDHDTYAAQSKLVWIELTYVTHSQKLYEGKAYVPFSMTSYLNVRWLFAQGVVGCSCDNGQQSFQANHACIPVAF